MVRALLIAVVLGVPAVAGAQVEIREYPLPPKLYAHDVWADPAPDGPVYISFQRSGFLGILDPKTGKVDTVALGQDSAPHGVIQDRAGDLWLTDGGQNAIVRVNGRSREVTKWHLPAARGYVNLNTAIFDGAGVHWFTGQNGIVGRLDPRSGEMKVFDAPKGRGPYGIHATPEGVVYFTSLAGSYIARVDPADAITVIEPPTAGQGARRVWSDSKGVLWVAEWNSGQLSRFDPKTNAWKAWKAPGERPRVYAVYVDEQDRPWVSEWTAQAMLRFDPKTETFESFKSSTRTANVRQIHGRKGEVWTPESAADKLVVYRFK